MKHSRYNKPYSRGPPPWATNPGRYEDSRSWANGSRSQSPPRSSRRWPPRPPKRKQNGSSYSDAKKSRNDSSQKGIQMLVTSIDFPNKHLTEEQLDQLQQAILAEIGKITGDSFSPQFLDSFKRRGNLILYCNNEDSVEWLKRTVAELKPWEGAEFKVLQQNELPNLVDFYVTIPGNIESDVFLKRVDKQNEDLKASTWNVISKKLDEKEKNTVLSFSVDETIADILKKINNKIFFNFTRLSARYLGSLRNRKEETKPEPEAEKTAKEEKVDGEADTPMDVNTEVDATPEKTEDTTIKEDVKTE